MNRNTVSIYIKGNKGYYGLHVEQDNKILGHYCSKACDEDGNPILQNCAEIEAACNALLVVEKNALGGNCKIDIFSNLNLLDKFESKKAQPDKLKPYITKFNNIVDKLHNINHLEKPTFHWLKKEHNSKIDILTSELDEYKKTH